MIYFHRASERVQRNRPKFYIVYQLSNIVMPFMEAVNDEKIHLCSLTDAFAIKTNFQEQQLVMAFVLTTVNTRC